MTGTSNRYIPTLTAMRFIAAFMVFGFHFFSFHPDYILLNTIFRRGFLGVDFFFLLSGFVIGYSYFDRINDNSSNFSKKNFFISRFSRIAPVYYLALVLSIPTFIYQLNLLSSTQRAYAWSTIPLTLTFLQSFSGLSITQDSWNVPSWSLSVELFFYLIFPFLSYKIIKSKYVKQCFFLFLVINILLYFSISGLPTSVELLGTKFDTSWRNIPFFHLPQFLLGNCLSSIFLKNKSLNSKYSFLGFIIFAGLTSYLFSYPLANLDIQSGNPLVVICFSGLIFFSALVDKYIGKFLPVFIILLGEASYSLYILQSPTKALLQQAWSKLFKIPYVDGFAFAFYLSFFAILIAILSYKFFELPMKNKLIHHYQKKQQFYER